MKIVVFATVGGYKSYFSIIITMQNMFVELFKQENHQGIWVIFFILVTTSRSKIAIWSSHNFSQWCEVLLTFSIQHLVWAFPYKKLSNEDSHVLGLVVVFLLLFSALGELHYFGSIVLEQINVLGLYG